MRVHFPGVISRIFRGDERHVAIDAASGERVALLRKETAALLAITGQTFPGALANVTMLSLYIMADGARHL